MATAIGALSVDLAANSAAFAADMGKAQRALGSSSARMNRSLARMDKGWGAVDRTMGRVAGRFLAVAGPAALLLLTKRSLHAADAIGKTADSIGVGTDALQEYRHAAGLAGVETQAMDGAFTAFGKRLGELKVGTGTLNIFLDKFDKQLKQNIVTAGSTEAALELIFEAMANTGDETKRAALAAAAFGRTAGVQMGNMVNDGADALMRMREEARALGLVLDESLIRGAEQANDQMSRLSSVLDAKVTASLVRMAPAIDLTASRLLRFFEIVSFGIQKAHIDPEKLGLGVLQFDLDLTNEKLERLRDSMANFEEGGFAHGKLDAEAKRLQIVAGQLEARIDFLRKLGGNRGTPPPAAGADAGAITAALTTQLDRQVRSLVDRNLLFGESEGRIARVNAETRIHNALMDANIKRSTDLLQPFEIYLADLEAATNESVRLREAERARLDMQREMELRLAVERRQAEQQLEDQRRQTEMNANSAARAIRNGMQSMTADVNNASDALRTLAARLLEVYLQASLFGPLEASLTGIIGGYIGGGATGSGISPTGGDIQGTPFAHGGSFEVGGRGGTDANIVPLALTKGERVTVETVAQQRRGGGGGDTYNNFQVDMRGASLEAVRRLEALVAGVNASIEPRAVAAIAESSRRGML